MDSKSRAVVKMLTTPRKPMPRAINIFAYLLCAVMGTAVVVALAVMYLMAGWPYSP